MAIAQIVETPFIEQMDRQDLAVFQGWGGRRPGAAAAAVKTGNDPLNAGIQELEEKGFDVCGRLLIFIVKLVLELRSFLVYI